MGPKYCAGNIPCSGRCKLILSLLMASFAGIFSGCGSSGGSLDSVAPSEPPPHQTAVPQTTMYALNIPANDIAWDSTQKVLYATVAKYASSNANSVVAVDPVSGNIKSSQALSAEPNLLGVSDDDTQLYVGIDSASQVERLALPALTPDIKIALGTLPGCTCVLPATATSIQVAPGNPHRTAILRGQNGDASGGLVLFDDATQRGVPYGGEFSLNGGPAFISFTWGGNQSTLYASSDMLTTLTAGTNGISTLHHSSAISNPGATQYSPSTGLIYGQTGTVSNPSTDMVLGMIRQDSIADINQGLVVADPSLNRMFILGSTYSGNAIEAFDLTTFTFIGGIRFSSPLPQGATRMIRWGSAGLAIVTGTGYQGVNVLNPANIFIIDGPFVNPAVAPDESKGTPLLVSPLVFSMSPQHVTAGSPAITLTVTGANFTPTDIVFWNGSTPLPTAYVSSTQLTAQIPASQLTAPTNNAVTVADANTPETISSDGNSFAGSNGLYFNVFATPPSGVSLSATNLAVRGLVWDPTAQLLYASTASYSPVNGSSLAVINPTTLDIESLVALPGNPGTLSLSDDGQYLYAGLDDAGSVTRLLVRGFSKDITWPLGADPTFGPYFALDLQAEPGQPHSTAISLGSFQSAPPSIGGVKIFDDTTPRPKNIAGNQGNFDSLQWGVDGSTLYAANLETTAGDFYQLGVSSQGVALTADYPGVLPPNADPYPSQRIHYDPATKYLYLEDGDVIDPKTGTAIGSFNASGPEIVDASKHRVYFLGQTGDQQGTESYTIEAFDQQSMQPIGSLVLKNLTHYQPYLFMKWGNEGFAIAPYSLLDYSQPSGALYVLNGDFVSPASAIGAIRNGNVHRTWVDSSNRTKLPISSSAQIKQR